MQQSSGRRGGAQTVHWIAVIGVGLIALLAVGLIGLALVLSGSGPERPPSLAQRLCSNLEDCRYKLAWTRARIVAKAKSIASETDEPTAIREALIASAPPNDDPIVNGCVNTTQATKEAIAKACGFQIEALGESTVKLLLTSFAANDIREDQLATPSRPCWEIDCQVRLEAAIQAERLDPIAIHEALARAVIRLRSPDLARCRDAKLGAVSTACGFAVSVDRLHRLAPLTQLELLAVLDADRSLNHPAAASAAAPLDPGAVATRIVAMGIAALLAGLLIGGLAMWGFGSRRLTPSTETAETDSEGDIGVQLKPRPLAAAPATDAAAPWVDVATRIEAAIASLRAEQSEALKTLAAELAARPAAPAPMAAPEPTPARASRILRPAAAPGPVLTDVETDTTERLPAEFGPVIAFKDALKLKIDANAFAAQVEAEAKAAGLGPESDRGVVLAVGAIAAADRHTANAPMVGHTQAFRDLVAALAGADYHLVWPAVGTRATRDMETWENGPTYGDLVEAVLRPGLRGPGPEGPMLARARVLRK